MTDVRTPTRRYYRWAEIVTKARRHPDRWVLAVPDVPATVIKSVRERRHPDLRIDDGELEGVIRNRHTTDAGQIRGDLFVRFRPTKHP